jgi:hypothetical protein
MASFFLNCFAQWHQTPELSTQDPEPVTAEDDEVDAVVVFEPDGQPKGRGANRLFVLTFNNNDQALTDAVIADLFADVHGAACVVLSFQEYDLQPSAPVPAKPLFYDAPGSSAAFNRDQTEPDTARYLRAQRDDAATDASRLAAFHAALGPGYALVADAAMGEHANHAVADGAEWFGFVRLLVFARRDTSLGAALCADSGRLTCVVPSGNKASRVAAAAADGNDPASAPYAAGLSPDKGVVLAYFPTAGLLCCAAHFHGTNKHGVPERVFDAVRRQQLMRAGEAAAWLVAVHGERSGRALARGPTTAGFGNGAELGSCGLVLAGDLNFRVESEFASAEDKQAGGKDWVAVHAGAASRDPKVLRALYLQHDRLRMLLGARGGVAAPPLVAGCADAVGCALAAAHQLLPPTFAYQPNAPPPRPYKTKRAPSWADRVLTRDLACFLGAPATPVVCKSLPHVVCSDHEPVVAIFST